MGKREAEGNGGMTDGVASAPDRGAPVPTAEGGGPRWTTAGVDEERARRISAELEISPVLGRLLVQRGFPDAGEAEAFIRPRLAALENPYELENLEAAARRIERAVEDVEDVVIFGDYDADGVTSTVQLVSLLRELGLDPRYCVPRRMEEGYGLGREAIERVFDGKVPDLFVALDCGTNAGEPIAHLRALGVDVIVVDHHRAKEGLPPDCLLVNPHVNDRGDAPWRDLSTAGLVFKLMHGLLKRRRAAEDPRVAGIRLKDYLDLVALGTVADLVPLHGENRILSWFGLRHLRANGRPGVRALAEVSGIANGQEMGSADISFKLGPRINASGRIADAELPINLLLSRDSEACREMARELNEMNRERQTIERKIVEVAEKRAADDFGDRPGIVLFAEDWHPGVVGIVAGRVSRRFHKPCVILGGDGEDAKGSGRSIPSVDLVAVFQRCADLLGHWGGHPMAAGVTVARGNIDAFASRFNEALREMYPDGAPGPVLSVSAWLAPEDLTESLLDDLEQLHPFGQGNAEPVFGIRNVLLEETPKPFGNGSFRFRLPASAGSRGVSGVAWRMGTMPDVGRPLDLVVKFGWNYWRGSRYPQVTLVDWRAAG